MPLISGDRDPHHNRIIKTVAVEVNNDFYVFIDEKNEIYYHVMNPNHQYPPDFNKVNSCVRRLEVLVLSNLDNKQQSLYTFLLANTLGECLEEPTIDRALQSLTAIEKDIERMVNSYQKKFYNYGTNLSLIIVACSIFALHNYRYHLVNYYSYNSFMILFCSLFGGIGALIFNYSRTRKYKSSRVIGRFYHFFDGGLRIIYGTIYALIIILGIKAGAILNFVNGQSIYLFAFLGTIAGASDTFIVRVIESFESRATEPRNNNE